MLKTDYEITKTEDKRAKVEYKVETGKPFLIDSITENIKSPIIDTIYQKIKKDAIIKTNEKYKTVNFEQERERLGNYYYETQEFTISLKITSPWKWIPLGLIKK